MSDSEIYDPASHSSQAFSLLQGTRKLVVPTPHILRKDVKCIYSGENINAALDAQGPFIVPAPNFTWRNFYFTETVDANSSKNKSMLGEFIGIVPTGENFCKFADNYADLHLTAPLFPLREGAEEYVVPEQSVRFWQRSHLLLKCAFELSEWIKCKDVDKINRIIQWDINPELQFFTSFSYMLGSTATVEKNLSDKTCHRYMLSQFETLTICEENPTIFLLEGKAPMICRADRKDGSGKWVFHPDKMEAAKRLLAKLLNDNMSIYTTKATPYYDQILKTIVPSFAPSSILALMWYQLYKIIVGESRYKRCAICNQWQDVTHARTNWKSHRDCQARKEKQRQRALQKREGEEQ